MAWRAASLTSAGAAKSGKTLRKIHGIMLHRQTIISRNDGLSELFGLAESCGGGNLRHFQFWAAHFSSPG